jgi:methylenetetrahydrofolate reductase (NADPH)
MNDTYPLISNSVFELIPMKTTRAKAAALPTGATVSVTASPAQGMAATLDLAEELHADGFEVIPHISARLTKDRHELAWIVNRLQAVGIDHTFVVGGDVEEPGEYVDAMALIKDLDAIGHHFTSIGVAGYPEGHPLVPHNLLMQALIEKQPHATYITTQLCFDPHRIAAWVQEIRQAGLTLPVRVGVAGQIDTFKLMTIGARIGVGQSLRYLSKNRRAVARMLRPGHTTPDEVIDGLAPAAGELGLDGLHIFTFNAVEEAVEWYEKAMA